MRWRIVRPRCVKLAAEVADRFSATCCTTQEVAFVSAAMNRLAEPVGELRRRLRLFELADDRNVAEFVRRVEYGARSEYWNGIIMQWRR